MFLEANLARFGVHHDRVEGELVGREHLVTALAAVHYFERITAHTEVGAETRVDKQPHLTIKDRTTI